MDSRLGDFAFGCVDLERVGFPTCDLGSFL